MMAKPIQDPTCKQSGRRRGRAGLVGQLFYCSLTHAVGHLPLNPYFPSGEWEPISNARGVLSQGAAHMSKLPLHPQPPEVQP